MRPAPLPDGRSALPASNLIILPAEFLSIAILKNITNFVCLFHRIDNFDMLTTDYIVNKIS